MTKFLLIHGAKSTALGVVIATAFCLLAVGEAHALGALLGGGLAGLQFLLLVWLGGRLLDPMTQPGTKAVLVGLILGKFLIAGGLFWLLVTKVPVTGLGIALGIGSALTGFTMGLNAAIRSPEGESAIRAEEKKLQQENPIDSGDGDPPASA